MLVDVDVEISPLLDELVKNLIDTDPRYQSKAALTRLHDAASTIKSALLNHSSNISSEAKDSHEPSESIAQEGARPFPLYLNSTGPSNSTLQSARKLVLLAQKEANLRNKERISNPRVNNYYSKISNSAQLKARALDAQIHTVNTTIASAAALVAEADAKASRGVDPAENYPANQKRSLTKRATSFWMESIEHSGNFPYGSGNANYQVFRNVKSYGAKGDGTTDDTAAINRAISDGGRCGNNCGSSSVKGALVYFPTGTYLISSPIIAYYNTQMVGNANVMPVLLAAPSFVGLGVVTSDVYTGGNGGEEQWYINQSNFLRQMRNFIVDLRSATMIDVSGLHWQVAQATSLQKITFMSSNAVGKSHIGIFAENGSGGFMSDLIFSGGAVGIRCGNQQFTTRNFKFENVLTAIDMLWDWGWTWKSLEIINSQIGIKISGAYVGGSILVLDSKFTNTPVGIKIDTPKGDTPQQHMSVIIDNLVLAGVGTAVSDTIAGNTLAGGTRTITSWTQGRVYDTTHSSGYYAVGGLPARPNTASLMGGPNGGYFERSKDQYVNDSPQDFVSAKFACRGDGVTDDTECLRLMVAISVLIGRKLYLPAGSYIVTDTVTFTPGLRIVGECWSQIVAKGDMFTDAKNPRPMIRVGEDGQAGIMEIQDLMFTNEGNTAGVILMEWNIAQSSPGSAAMWDSHFRIGGAAGSKLQVANCPKLTGAVNSKCIAGSMLLHLTPSSSAYLENLWAWVADHDLDSGPAQTQIDIYVARGILVESTKATWMYGTSSEHCVLYQYNFFGAENIFMGMIQTESPYYLPKPLAPAPFTSVVGKFPGDPKFTDCVASNPGCAAAWGLMIVNSINIHIFGAGLYNWFQDYIQPCVDTQNCQQRVVYVRRSSEVFFYNLYTIGTVEMLNTAEGGSPILAKSNTNKAAHPFTSVINAWLGASSSISGSEEEEDDPADIKDPKCDGEHASLDDLVKVSSNLPRKCVDTYLMKVESKIMNDALNSYTDIVTHGYDAKFLIYARHIRELVPAQLRFWMQGAEKSGFFSCTKTTYRICCKSCKYGCTLDCIPGDNCVPGDVTEKTPCPERIPEPQDQGQVEPIAYTLLNREGFFKAIMDKYGIEESWVTQVRLKVRIPGNCWMSTDTTCGEKQSVYFTGFPWPTNIVVMNPKSLIEPTFDKSKALASELTSQANSPFKSSYLSMISKGDVVEGSSIPALLTAAGVTSMTKVVETADKITEQQRKDTILNFIMGVLMLVPGVGGILDAVGWTALRKVITLLGDLAAVATTMYEVIDNPLNAIFLIFGALYAGIGAQGFTKAAGKKRGLTATEMNGLKPIHGDLDKISLIRGTCRR